MTLGSMIRTAAALSLVLTATAPGGAAVGITADVRPVAELENTLTRTAVIDDAHTIRMTRITPDYLRAMYMADLHAGRIDQDFDSYQEAYRAGSSLAFRVTVEGGRRLSLMEFPGRAVLSDGRGHEYASEGWRERPEDGSGGRDGVLFFPMFCRDGGDLTEATRLLSVSLRGVGRPGEARFRWVFDEPSP